MGERRTQGGLVFGALLLPCLLASTANASTNRWGDVQLTPTADDGLAVVGASFEGRQVLGPVAVPFFTVDGVRHELTDATRVAGPTSTRGEGLLQVSATYRVPTSRGDVSVTVYHAFSDADAQWADLGRFGSWVEFSGPEADYAFYWRIDPDLDGAGNDRLQVFSPDEHGAPAFRTPATESTVDLRETSTWLGRVQLKMIDGPSYADLTSLFLESSDRDARVYAVRSGAGENEALPSSLVNGQTLQQVLGHGAGVPGAGEDMVLWYESRATGSMGFLGPQFLTAVGSRKGFLEIDKMKRTEFPPNSANIDGGIATIPSAFATGDFNMTDVIKDAEVAFDVRSSYAELDAMLNAGKSFNAQESPTNWYVYHVVAWNMAPPLGFAVLGVMFDDPGIADTNGKYREGSASFWNPLTKNYTCEAAPPNDCNTALLWTIAHETGHAFNLHHEDWEFAGDPASDFFENSAIMGYSYDIGTLHWSFGPDNGVPHLKDHPDDYVRPGFGVPFIKDPPIPSPYNMCEGHEAGHDPT